MAAETLSSFLKYLPALFRQSRVLEANAPLEFLGRFLLAFEHILSRPRMPKEARDPDGLEERIERSYEYIDVDKTSRDFLPWLAGWVATRVSEDMTDESQRAVIRAAVQRHQRRGTMEALMETLNTALDPLNDPNAPPQHRPVLLEELVGTPHAFRVTLTLMMSDAKSVESWTRLIQDLIAQEKPAHTYCQLTVKTPNIRFLLWESREQHLNDSIVVGQYQFPVPEETSP